MKILLDTSFLITSIKHKIDVFNLLKSHNLIILDGVKKELENLIKEKKTGRNEAKIALVLLKKNKIKVKKAKNKNVDDAIVEEKDAVATQDKELKKRLKGRKIITIRQKKTLIGI